ncbi:XkdX family protein [Lapidilactobacillus wuchangensis]|nr:XkdX family protein [Lapidilactobacillus wuchangensis]
MAYLLTYYQMKKFNDDDMKLFVTIGWITQEQYDSVKA